MTFLVTLTMFLSCAAVTAVHQDAADIFYHSKVNLGASMWHFSSDGLTIYSPSGEEILKEHRKTNLCEDSDCSFFTMASDGHKYVWAAAFAPSHSAMIFDIDTGDYVGYHDVCSTPLDLAYHATREEMWLRCAAKGGKRGEIDVFSSNSLSSDFTLVDLNGTVRPYGRVVVDSSLGNSGYVSSYNMNWITEIDLSSKMVKHEYEIPLAYGSYDMTYSPINEHLFVRVRVCCTCGSDDSDLVSCGYWGAGNVTVQTGPSASPNPQWGKCSGSCEGTVADTIGVTEFDTVSKTFVGDHNIMAGTGWGADPAASFDGEHILLLPNDGGQYVRILKAGANGEASTFLADIHVDFSGEPNENAIVVSDYAFVKDSNRNILVLAADTDNHVVLVDLDDDDMAMRKINMAPDAETSTGGTSRKVEWAYDTDYVWVNGGGTGECYIIKMEGGIDSAELFHTLTDVTGGNMLFVQNYALKEDGVDGRNGEAGMNGEDGTDGDDGNNVNKDVATAAVVVAVIALVSASFALGMQVSSMSKVMKKSNSSESLSTKSTDSVSKPLNKVQAGTQIAVQMNRF